MGSGPSNSAGLPKILTWHAACNYDRRRFNQLETFQMSSKKKPLAKTTRKADAAPQSTIPQSTIPQSTIPNSQIVSIMREVMAETLRRLNQDPDSSVQRSELLEAAGVPGSQIQPSWAAKKTSGVRTGAVSARVIAARPAQANRNSVTFQDSRGRLYYWLASSRTGMSLRPGDECVFDATIVSERGNQIEVTRVMFKEDATPGRRPVKPHR